jgi:regulatory protein
MAYSKSISPEQALVKARHYCGYQERCHQEVKEKLYGFGLYKNQVEQLLAQLIEEDYLNEERFAVQFAGGKFRMKNWGRNRIQNELKLRKVSDYCIKKAMKELPDEDYQAALEKIAAKKWESLGMYGRLEQQKKTQDYLLYKGYEWPLIQQTMKKLATGGGA